MTDQLPLFPLGTVLLPGVVLPLHIFEQRYRALIAELLELPEPHRYFGVVAIREGHEVGTGGARALHEVGCTAHLRQVHRHEDGRYDIVTSGVQRFRLQSLDETGPFLRAQVELLPDLLESADAPGQALPLDRAVRAALRAYVGALGTAAGEHLELPELPEEPLVLGYLVAGSLQVELAERQALLAAPDGTARLRAALTLLRREIALLTTLSATASSEHLRTPVSLN